MKFDLHSLTGSLKHYHYDVFQVEEGAPSLGGTKLTFQMNGAGEIDRVAIALEPSVKEIIFPRKPKTQDKAMAPDRN